MSALLIVVVILSKINERMSERINEYLKICGQIYVNFSVM